MCDSEKKAVVLATGKVLKIQELQTSVFELVIKIEPFCEILPGQFFMLSTGKTFLSRPISVFHFDCKEHIVHFLILQKGEGTKALCSLIAGSSINLLGPVGNSFNVGMSVYSEQKKENSEKIAIIGGGIGVAPVAGFAETLENKTFDFYACFKSGSYGLDYIKPANLEITTDDGSVGKRGMLPDVLTSEILLQKSYTRIFACGPEPMLKYVQKIAKEANIPAFLSLEARMACGMGACLGCTIKTTDGNKRCCKDGPVFPSESIIFEEKVQPTRLQVTSQKKDSSINPLACNIAGVEFKNPVIAASGTFGYGSEYQELFDVSKLGGICSKGLTLEARSGNTGVRLLETSGGIINSIGLENPGIEHFIANELVEMQKLGTTVIANLSGSSIETYVKGAELLDKTSVPMIELNISCPNVKAGGMAFGLQPEVAFSVTQAIRQVTSKPLMVKLSPNALDLCSVAEAVIKAGADALSLVNTFKALAIDVEKEKFLFDNVTAGLSGPGIKPLALRMVWEVCNFMKTLPAENQVPVVGLGGIRTWQDGVEFIMAGASAIQVGTSTFSNPLAMLEIVEGISSFMKRKNYSSISEFRGIL